jgi:predicted PurR-regulated permease PerM
MPVTLPPTPVQHRYSRTKLTAFYVASFAIVIALLWTFRILIKPLLLAGLIAYIVAPFVEWMQKFRIGHFYLPRWIAVLILYACLISVTTFTIIQTAPRLMKEMQQLVAEVPALSQKVRQRWLPEIERMMADTAALYQAPASGKGTPRSDDAIKHRVSSVFDQLLSEMEHPVISLLRQAKSVVRAILGGIFATLLILMASAYLVLTRQQIQAFFRSLLMPKHHPHFDALLRRLDRGLAGVVRGQLIICGVNGLLSGIGFYLADLAYWPVLTAVATVFSIIPIFGAILSSIPALVIALQQDMSVAVFVGLWIIAIHQLEANLLNPKIVGDAARLHPVAIMFAIVGAELLFGIVGALLAVPVLSILSNIYLYFRDVCLYPERVPQTGTESTVPSRLIPDG